METDKQWEPLLEEAKILHKQGVNGDEDAVKDAYKIMKSLRSKTPQNNLIEAYYGSIMTLLGRDATDTMERFRLVRSGLKILDQVVKKNPENTEIRILRGYVSYNLPETFFQRTSTAIEDFEYIVSQYESNESIITRGFFWQILYDLGVAYKRFEQFQDSKNTWLKLLQHKPEQKFLTLLEQEGITEDLQAQFHSNVETPHEEEHIFEKMPEPLPEPVPAEQLSSFHDKESNESIQPNEDIITTEAAHYVEGTSERETAKKEIPREKKNKKEQSARRKSSKKESSKEPSKKEKSQKEPIARGESPKRKSEKEEASKEQLKKGKSQKEPIARGESKKKKSEKEESGKGKSKKEKSQKEQIVRGKDKKGEGKKEQSTQVQSKKRQIQIRESTKEKSKKEQAEKAKSDKEKKAKKEKADKKSKKNSKKVK